MQNCPVCKSSFINKGYYSECANRECTTLFLKDKAVHVDLEKVKLLLKDSTLKTNKLAKSMLNFLIDRGFLTKAQLAYIVGEINPKGNDTLQRVASSRSGKKFSVGTIYKDIPDTPIMEAAKEMAQDLKKVGVKIDLEKLNRDFSEKDMDSEIIYVTGKEELMDPKTFEHMDFAIPEFNPLQSVTAKYVNEDINLVVAANTSSGKTIVAEQFISPIIKMGKKAVYISPLKALTQEKFDDWTDPEHYFSRYNCEIMTSDYGVITPERVKKLNASHIISLTSEMFDSRTRKYDSEKNEWLKEVGIVIIDEAHLLGMKGRGDNLESAIMRFTDQNPVAKIVFLSATMPNINELANWLSFLNGKKTTLIKSDWRPIQLDAHLVPYQDYGDYSQNERAKAETVIKIVQEHPTDKFLIFTHTKKLGRMITELLQMRLHEDVEFHMSDLTKEKRRALESSFKQKDGGLRLLVATSTLAWGINAPARRVIVAGIHRGIEQVTSMEVIQMIGRSGRYGIDDKGDAYILLPERSFDDYKTILNSENIMSKISNPSVMGFHAISEMVRGVITNKEELNGWYRRTLAYFQDGTVDVEDITTKVESDLIRQLALKIDELYKPTGLGVVSAKMYYHPVTVVNWYFNFSALSINEESKDDPLWLSAALSMPMEYYPPSEVKFLIKGYEELCRRAGITNKITFDPTTGYLFYSILTGNINSYFFSQAQALKMDSSRIVQAIQLIDNLYGRWKFSSDFYNTLRGRLLYGVPTELLELCRIKGIGGKKATALHKLGVRTINDVVNPNFKNLVFSVLGKKAEDYINNARGLEST